MKKKVWLWSVGWLWLVGCVADGSPEDLEMEVDTSSGVPVFSWAGNQPVHALRVLTCEACECEEGSAHFGTAVEVWKAGVDYHPSAWWQQTPALVGPVVYGDQDVLWARWPTPLVPGATYVATLVLAEPDDLHPDESGASVAEGCAIFTAP